MLSLVDFLQCTFMAGFRNNFQDNDGFWNYCLKSQPATGKPEQATWRGLFEGFSQLHIKWFQNFFLGENKFIHKNINVAKAKGTNIRPNTQLWPIVLAAGTGPRRVCNKNLVL
jgi:hypothetical protein